MVGHIVTWFAFAALPIFATLIGLYREHQHKSNQGRLQTPCRHGIVGTCAKCAEQIERESKQQKLQENWEKLRRSEIRRLSRLRLASAASYNEMQPKEFEDAVAKLFR